MKESPEMFSAVNYIKNKADVLEKLQMLSLRSDNDLYDDFKALLQADPILLRIYKEVDGIKSQKEIAEAVEVNEMRVSRGMRVLEENGLVEIKEVGTNGKKIYKHSIAEQVFKLSRL